MGLKNSLLIVLLLLSNNSFGMEKQVSTIDKMSYKTNSFGDVFPLWEDIPSHDLAMRLYTFIDLMKDKVPGKSFLVNIPHEKAAAIIPVRSAGFILRDADNEKTEWIFTNNSSIPEPFSTIFGTSIFVQKGNDVLVIEEKTHPGILGFPGGTAELNELPRATACRELKKEVGLEVRPEVFKLFGIINPKRVNEHNVIFSYFCYMIKSDDVKGNITIDPNEILRAFYVSLKDIVTQDTIQGLEIWPGYKALAEHLLNNNFIVKKSYS